MSGIEDIDYSILFEKSIDAVFISEQNGRILNANPAACSLFGWSVEEFRRIGRRALVDPSDPAVQSALEERKRAGSVRAELMFVRKDGSKFLGDLTSTLFSGGELAIVIIRDISERKRIEEETRANERHYRLLSEYIPHLVWSALPDGGIDYCNKRLLDFLQRTMEEMYGWLWISSIHPDDLEQTLTAWRSAIETKTEYRVEYRIRNGKDGSYRWYLGSALPQLDSQGTVARWVGTCTDIHERKLAEERLQQLHARLELALLSAGAGTWEWDVTAGLISASPDLIQLFELHAEAMKQPTIDLWERRLHPEDRERVMSLMEEAFAKNAPLSIEYRILRSDGEVRWVHSLGHATQGDSGPIRVSGLCTDITARKQSEQQLLEHEKQLRALASELTLVEQRERRRLAAQLHDSIAQSLALSKFNLHKLHAALSGPEKTSLQQVLALMEQALNDTRSLMSQLSPIVLDQLGLWAALESLAEDMTHQHQLNCSFVSRGKELKISDDLGFLLYSAARELLINVVKHAKAKKAELSVSTTDSAISVVVRDDGIGFNMLDNPPANNKHRGFGLFSIRERLASLGGKCEIESPPGGGSRVTVTAPLPQLTP